MRISKQLVSYHIVSSILNSSVAKSVFREKFLLFKLVRGFHLRKSGGRFVLIFRAFCFFFFFFQIFRNLVLIFSS